MTDPVLVRQRHDAVLVLRLNRPKARNALTGELISQIGLALESAEQDAGTRCVVVTGTGDRAFCAGMDLREFADGNGGDPDHRRGAEIYHRFVQRGVDVPVVGAANATAVAGGFELLLACDVVVASETARFALPEVKRGLFPAGGGVFLGTRIPLAVALELTLTGDPIDASRAVSLGLVNEVVPAPDVLDSAVRLARRIAANGPLAVRATREMVRTAVVDAAAARALETEWMPRVFESEDAKEGARAFIERRDPEWTGR